MVSSLFTSPRGAIPSPFVSSGSTLRLLGMVIVLFPVCWDSQTKWKTQRMNIWTHWILENTAASSLVKLTHGLNWALGSFVLESLALFLILFDTNKIYLGTMRCFLVCKKLSVSLANCSAVHPWWTSSDVHLLICLLFIFRYRFASLPFWVTFGAKLSVRDSLRWLSIQSFLLCLFSWEEAKNEQTKGQLGLHSLNTVLFINKSSEIIQEASEVMPTLGMGLSEEWWCWDNKERRKNKERKKVMAAEEYRVQKYSSKV